MIDPLNDTLLTLKEASRICPRIGGKKPHITSLWRWAKYGVHGHQLECVRVGNRYCTTEDALVAFFRAVSMDQAPERVAIIRIAKPRSDGQREKAIADARRRLEARGHFKLETRH